MSERSGQLGGNGAERRLQGPRLDSARPEGTAASASQREVLSCEPLSRTERCW